MVVLRSNRCQLGNPCQRKGVGAERPGADVLLHFPYWVNLWWDAWRILRECYQYIHLGVEG